jgi:hypothetical protein
MWLKKTRTNRMIGPSLRNGAKAAGIVRSHPFVRVREIRYVRNGPGCTAAANAKVIPRIR